MAGLSIKTRSKSAIDPKFSEYFVAIVEEDADAPINMICVNPFLEVTDENRQENTDIQNMAVFLLISNEMMAVKWGDKFYFGDVDLMDSEFLFDEDADDVTIVQYEL